MLPATWLPFSFCCVALLYVRFATRHCHSSADEPLMRIELTTSSLPRKCSTTELQRLLKSLSQWAIGHWSRSSHWLTDLMTNDNSERKTRFEPATYSLEGCRSTNWATSAFTRRGLGEGGSMLKNYFCIWLRAVAQATASTVGKDGFEPPNSEEGRFTVCCRWPLGYLPQLIWEFWNQNTISQ